MLTLIKLFLSILLLICLLPMPYGYYQLVRFTALIGFAYLAYQSKQKDRQAECLTFIILAILFQPFLKIALGRTLWNLVDVIVAIALIASIFRSDNPIDKTNNTNK